MIRCLACIFDLDGVIVDTAKYHYLAWKRLAAELGFEFLERHNERLKGVSRMRSLEILLEVGGLEVDEPTKQALAEKKNAWYREYILQMDASEILPGAREFVEGVRARDIAVALGSASKNAGTILRQIGMGDSFHAVVDGTTVTHAKPDPEVFLTAARELGVPPAECVVFEDAQAGIEAAHNGGMLAVAVGRAENLTGADRLIAGLHEISPEQFERSA